MNNIDLSLFDDSELMCPDIDYLEPPMIAPKANDYYLLSSQMDQISINLNTQQLRNKLEKCKRQRLSTTIQNIEREIATLTSTVNQTQANIVKLNNQIEGLITARN